MFLRLGFTAFGGPAAHIAMMHDEVVLKRKWLSEQEFLDLLGATNLIPGPNSTEMAHHVGFLRGGWRGMLVAGVSFIVPAMLIVLAFAAIYTRYQTLPQLNSLLYGIKPVVIAIILQALFNLGRQAIKNFWLVPLIVAVFGLYFIGVNEIALLIGAGLLVMAIRGYRERRTVMRTLWIPWLTLAPLAVASVSAFSPVILFLTFVKIGSVLYGSGYVLLAFLHADFVESLGWLTEQQLLDAVAIGQFTPGPLFTTATFIGYVLGGVPGAILATVGIFLPSFIFVVLTNDWVKRFRKSPAASAFLDGVNASALALMAAVTWQLGRASLVDPPTAILALAAFMILLSFRINSAWLVLAGGLVGLLLG